MSQNDDSTTKTAPRESLVNLKEAAKPTPLQNFRNYFGFGYVGNTVTAIAITNAFKKFTPGLVNKWAGSYEKKYIARKEAELITPYGDKMDEAAKDVIREKIREDAKEYGHKTVEGRLLASGGFLMLPFQSAAQINDYSKNVSGIVGEYEQQHGKTALLEELDAQRAAARAGKDGKTLGMLDTAHEIVSEGKEKPKFNPLGPAAAKDLPKWATGRVVALGTAFTVQKFVDDRFGKQKDAVDHTIAKIITKAVRGRKGGEAPAEPGQENAFAQDAAKSANPDIDPKILNTVRMVTTDAYMTTVAIAAQKFSVDAWDNKLPGMRRQLAALTQKFSGGKEHSL